MQNNYSDGIAEGVTQVCLQGFPEGRLPILQAESGETGTRKREGKLFTCETFTIFAYGSWKRQFI